jgi:hypothetical protein
MEIRVNLGAVGIDLDNLIEAKLKERELPACLGYMIPPMLSKIMDVDDKEILALTESLKDEEKADADMQKFIVSKNIDKTTHSLTKEGLEKIEHSKIDLADIYTSRLIKCVQCPVTDVCNKLTQNYLKVVSMENPQGGIK